MLGIALTPQLLAPLRIGGPRSCSGSASSGTWPRSCAAREQVRYVHEVLEAIENAGLDGAFWYSFANYDKPLDMDPRYDLDLASFGVVRVFSARGPTWELKQPWEPKAAFDALASRYGVALD
jgi:hypothetical protein